MYVGAQKLILDVSLDYSPPYILSQVLSLSQELMDSSQLAPGMP